MELNIIKALLLSQLVICERKLDHLNGEIHNGHFNSILRTAQLEQSMLIIEQIELKKQIILTENTKDIKPFLFNLNKKD